MTAAPLAILVPVAAAAIGALLSAFTERREGILALVALVATAVLCALVLGDAAARPVIWLGGWHPQQGVATGIALAIDPLGAAAALYAALLGVLASVMAMRLVRDRGLLFDALLLALVAAMVGFCLAGDLFTMFVLFELMSVAAFVLVAYEVNERAPLAGGLTFAVTNSAGAILLLFGIALLYGETGALNLAQLARAVPAADHTTTTVAFALICAGFLVKAAALPFHFWLADAYTVAPTPVCIVLAGVFSELGLFGLARVVSTVFAGALDVEGLRPLLVAFGAATALTGAVMCFWQHHLKRQLAFATVAQLGLYLIAIGLADTDALAGAAIWIAGDGLARAALFGAVGMLQHRFDSIREDELHGRGRELWPLGVLAGAAVLALASLPPFGPFLGRAIVEDAATTLGWGWIPPFAALVTALVAGTLLRMFLRVFVGVGTVASVIPGSVADEARRAGEEETEREASEAGTARSPALWIPVTVLTVASLALGLVPGLADAAARAAAAFRDTAGFTRIVLDGAHLPLPDASVPPPSAASYLYAAVSVLGAALVAIVALAPTGRTEPGVLRGLRRLHSGRAGDYAAGVALGAAALVVGGLALL